MAIQEFSASAVIAAYQRAAEADQRRILRYMAVSAAQHATALQRSYPRGRTGNLAGRILLEQRNAYSWRVLATAPHLGLWEKGTRRRQGRGGAGTGRGSRSGGALANRGAMPAGGATFIPLAIRYRGQAIDAVRALMARTVEV